MRPPLSALALTLLLVPAPAAPAPALKERVTCKGYTFPINRAALSPDGRVLAAGGGDTRGGELKLWDAATGKELASLPGYTNTLQALVFSPDGRRLASGGLGPLQAWDVRARRELARFTLGEYVNALAFSPDGTRLAAAGWYAAVRWDVASGRVLASFRRRTPCYGPVGLAFSRDLRTLAVRDYQEIDLWDTAAGKVRATLSEHRGEVGFMAFAADGKTLIAAGRRYYGRHFRWQGDVKLWDVAAARERAAIKGPVGAVLAAALSPDGKTLALLDSPELQADADLKLVDLATNRRHILRPPRGWPFLSLGFTDAGALWVTATSGGTVKLFEVSRPRCPE